MQATFEIFCLQKQIASLISLGVCLRSVHVSLAIHYFVIFPVYNRTAGYSHLEHIGIGAHKIGCHESAEAPAVNSELFAVDVRQRFQKLNAFNLILHLFVAEMTECNAFEIEPAIFRTPVVEHENYISFLRHIYFPAAKTVKMITIYIVGVRTSVNVNHSGVFL